MPALASLFSTCVVQLRLPVEVASLTLLYYLKSRVELLTMPSTEFHPGDRSRDVVDQQLAGIPYKKFHIRTLSYVYSRFSNVQQHNCDARGCFPRMPLPQHCRKSNKHLESSGASETSLRRLRSLWLGNLRASLEVNYDFWKELWLLSTVVISQLDSKRLQHVCIWTCLVW